MEKAEIIKNKINSILEYFDAKTTVMVAKKDDNSFDAVIEGPNLNFLIGARGESLDAMQTLLNLILFKELKEWTQVLVDINGYRTQKNEKIEQITKNYIDKVRFLGREMEMHPMSPAERRLVHTFVSGYDDIMSESTGEGKDRKVIIKPKKKD